MNRDVIGRAVDDAMQAAIDTPESVPHADWRVVAEQQIDNMVGVFESLAGPTLQHARDRAAMYGPIPGSATGGMGAEHHVQVGIMCALVDIADSLRVIAGRNDQDSTD